MRLLDRPVYIIPGNHDRCLTLRHVFADRDYWPIDDKFLHFTLEDYPLRIVALDTLLPGVHERTLCPERLAWFVARLQEAPERPTAVFMHHPPFKTFLPYPDSLMCRNGDAFGDIVASHPQIQAIICGHVHRDIVTHWRGVAAYVTASATFSNGLILHLVDDIDPLFDPPPCAVSSCCETNA